MALDSRIHILDIGLEAAQRNCRKISCRRDFQTDTLNSFAQCKFSSIARRYQPPLVPFIADRR
jgi:hypothetical protein